LVSWLVIADNQTKEDVVKIDDPIKKTGGLNVGATQTRASKGTEKTAAGKAGAATSDNVHLSTQVQSLSASSGVFDTNKVEEIKAAIASGQFQVNAEKIADGLMDTVKDLIHSRKA